VSSPFNTSITAGCFLASWKISKEVLVAKVSNLLESGLFEPISILSALSKALEIVMRDQMVAYFTNIGALSSLQSGFCLGHSTIHGITEYNG
jgi:hypothetical protein